MRQSNFQPPWTETPPAPGSFRSLFKWGAPDVFKHPNARLYDMLKKTFALSDTAFQTPADTGDTPVMTAPESRLSQEQIREIAARVGTENLQTDAYSRIRYSMGKTTEEALSLRKKQVHDIADAIVHPKNKDDVQKMVAWCHENRIPLSIYGGGSSVTLGLQMPSGGVVLVMGTHMNRILDFNEQDQTVTVEPGMMGPDYEAALQDAPARFGATRPYTGGHFPQSFEFSSVGGWIVTLGSGQASSYYGDAADLLLALEVITPMGTIRTHSVPATATGPKVADIFKGSEGAYGIVISLTLKIFRKMPANRQRFAYIFPSWQAAVEASREISQAECGMPAVFRISDPEETDVALKLYGVEGTLIDSLMKRKGYTPMERCICLGTAEGEKGFARNVKNNIHKIAKRFGAMSLTGYPVKKWEHGRYLDPYMREDLGDYGIIIDTLETSVKWSNLHAVHQVVREYIKERPQTVCMTHASHFYPQGTNLYFIFIAKMPDMDAYKTFHRGILQKIVTAGGTLSHHHGVGRMMAPHMTAHLGPAQMGLLRAIKGHLDPRGILVPGVLGL